METFDHQSTRLISWKNYIYAIQYEKNEIVAHENESVARAQNLRQGIVIKTSFKPGFQEWG